LPANAASAPSATEIGLNGWSSEPNGVDFVTLPSSLVGEYDRFDSYNGGFKWRAYTQESTPVEKK
jgi:hypothetical protein